MSLRIVCAVVLFLMGLVSPVLARGASDRLAGTIDPLALYGDTIRFSVWRDGREVGKHVTSFTGTAQGLRVDSRFVLAVPFLMFTAYRYEYRSSALWTDGVLVQLSASVNDDGKVSAFEARKDGTALAVFRDDGTDRLPLPVYPTNHWNSNVLGATVVLNTLTGRFDHVAIVDLGADTVTTAQGPRKADHYAYRGDLQAEVWYDGEGRWVKLRFKGSDGSTIAYRCESCGIPDVKTGNAATGNASNAEGAQ